MQEINFYLAGAGKLALAKFNTLINGKPDEEVIQFRVTQCKSCPLLKGRVCNPDVMKTRDGKEISLEEGSKLPHISEYGVMKAAIKNDEVYIRGCGCPLFYEDGRPNKPAHSFDEKDLDKRDGTGPCPMGRWSKKEFVEYLQKKDDGTNNGANGGNSIESSQ